MQRLISSIFGVGLGYGSRGGRPPFDPVSMFKGLILPLPVR